MIDRKGLGRLPSQPFYTYVQNYAEAGLSIFPCGKEEGKRPLCRSWKPYQRKPPTHYTLANWAETHPDANIGLVTGTVSGIVVIDSDDPKTRLEELFKRYGETPVVVQTPKGGYHLYYKYNGEKTDSGIEPNIDIRGEGGYVIAPPSINPNLGKQYQFILGSVEDFECLPPLKPEVSALYQKADYEKPTKPTSAKQIETTDNIQRGARNKEVFSQACHLGLECKGFDDLLNRLQRYNQENCSPPLSQKELRNITKSVMSYKNAGELQPKGQQWIKTPINEKTFELCLYHNGAYCLYQLLLMKHGNFRKEFAIAADAIEKKYGINAKTTRKNIEILIVFNIIKRTHISSKRKGDPHLYQFV